MGSKIERSTARSLTPRTTPADADNVERSTDTEIAEVQSELLPEFSIFVQVEYSAPPEV